MNRFDGRIALVTGAASGIGRATAIRLAREGASVICADQNEEGADETAGMIEGETLVLRFNAADPQSCRAMVDKAVAWKGGLDLLCNIAGVGAYGHFGELSEQSWNHVLAVNLNSLFHLSQAAIPHLLERSGNIVNVASAAGLVGTPYAVGYATSKHGVVGLTRSLAVEYASRQLRVNAVCPGAVDTPLIAGGFSAIDNIDPALLAGLMPKLRPVAQPSEIASAIAFLGSDDASFITGVTLPVDGGQTAA